MLKLLALERMMKKRNVIDNLKIIKLILEARKSSEKLAEKNCRKKRKKEKEKASRKSQ